METLKDKKIAKLEEVTYKKIYVHSVLDLPEKDAEQRYYVHIRGDFGLRWLRFPSGAYRQLRKKIDWYLSPKEQPDTAPTGDELIKKIAVGFFCHWWNTAGTNTDQGFDEWWKNHKQEYLSSKATKQTEK